MSTLLSRICLSYVSLEYCLFFQTFKYSVTFYLGQNEVILTIFKTRERHERYGLLCLDIKTNDIEEMHIFADSDHKTEILADQNIRTGLNNPRNLSQRRSIYTWIVQKAVISAAIISSERLSPKSAYAFGKKISVKGAQVNL